MSDEQRPDPVQSLYLHQGPFSSSEPSPSSPEAPPPVPENITIRWRGLVFVVAFVVLLAGVSRAMSPLAASVLAAIVILGLAGWAILKRRGSAGFDGDSTLWGGGGSGADCDIGGVGGGGGGDC